MPLRARAALVHPDFRLFLSARFLGLTSLQMLNVTLGQYVYEWTRNPLYLGYIGLALFLPKLAFMLLSGQAADRYDRRRVIFVCRAVQFLAALGLLLVVLFPKSYLLTLFFLLVLIGIAVAFDGPASQSIIPQLVPQEHLTHAVTWNSGVTQLSFIIGPALAGGLYGLTGGPVWPLAVVCGMRFLSALLILGIKNRTLNLERGEVSWETLLAGIRYIREKRILLGVLSLDLFAVLLGGAVALLPVYANDILHVGAQGLGWLRTAPAIGATLMGIFLAYSPPLKRAGPTMLICVALFGIFTILFGVSKSFPFSLLCLALLGGADMISVIIRGVLVQTETPHAMRGRVSAVNLIFIGASNELGEFESGVTAAWFGTVPAVVIGGLGTLAVVLAWSRMFPEIRQVKSLGSGPGV
jgi:MFS family permease